MQKKEAVLGTIMLIFLILLLLVVINSFYLPSKPLINFNESRVIWLKGLASTIEEYRIKDLDKNGINDYPKYFSCLALPGVEVIPKSWMRYDYLSNGVLKGGRINFKLSSQPLGFWVSFIPTENLMDKSYLLCMCPSNVNEKYHSAYILLETGEIYSKKLLGTKYENQPTDIYQEIPDIKNDKSWEIIYSPDPDG